MNHEMLRRAIEALELQLTKCPDEDRRALNNALKHLKELRREFDDPGGKRDVLHWHAWVVVTSLGSINYFGPSTIQIIRRDSDESVIVKDIEATDGSEVTERQHEQSDCNAGGGSGSEKNAPGCQVECSQRGAAARDEPRHV
jgi:hypothetical protein